MRIQCHKTPKTYSTIKVPQIYNYYALATDNQYVYSTGHIYSTKT